MIRYKNKRWFHNNIEAPTLKLLLLKLFNYGLISRGELIKIKSNYKTWEVIFPKTLLKIRNMREYIKTDPVTGVKYL